MVEQAFITSLIKSDGSIVRFFERPISAGLATCTIAALAWPLFVWIKRKMMPVKQVAAAELHVIVIQGLPA